MNSLIAFAVLAALLLPGAQPVLACGDGKPCAGGAACDDKAKKSSTEEKQSATDTTKTQAAQKNASKTSPAGK